MKQRRKKSVTVIIFLLLAAMLFPSVTVEAATPKRVIHVVYDDSGSMIRLKGENFDTWCQAKYAMEVFAAMLDTNDTMNVYVMSDYMNGKSPAPRLKLNGTDGAKNNVKKIHNMVTKAQDTPFASVKKAYQDLEKVTADEKWLVVLTDGEFDEFVSDTDKGRSSIDSYFSKKQDDIKVMFFGMGANAAEITANESADIFYEEAADTNKILSKVTDISTRIYNRDKLKVNTSSQKISFDVPMSQLIVFAQGAKVDIKGLKNAGGESFAAAEVVSVKYSEKAATNYDNVKVAKNLVGKVATFEGDFAEGEYTIDVQGAETVEVYYKPNVAIAAYLKNANGEEVTNIESLEAGDYTIEFGFIKTGTNQIVPQSDLLGKVTYSAIVTNNGKTHPKAYSSGDKITLEEGDLKIEAIAYFLDYNSVSTTLDYAIYKDKSVEFSVEKNPEYLVTSGGLTTSESEGAELEPIVIHITMDGKEFTSEEWETLDTPVVELGKKLDPQEEGFFEVFKFLNVFRKFNDMDEMIVAKGETPGEIHIIPAIKENNPKSGTYVGSEYTMKIYSQSGKAVWQGEMQSQIQVTDVRSLLEREAATVLRLVLTGFFIFILLGFTPLFKKRFPKSMKKNPTISCKPLPFGTTTEVHGRFTKDSMTSLLPFVAETGKLRFVPTGTVGIPAMKLKAGGGSKVIIMNTKSFVGKQNITIDGMSVPEEQTKLLQKSPSMMIDVTTENMRYSCVPRN